MVLDTNVVVSGLLSDRGAPFHLLNLMATGAFLPCLSEVLLGEYRDVLGRSKLRLNARRVAQFLADLRGLAFVCRPAAALVRLPDPGDQKVLEAAFGAKAGLIVTGNLKDFPATSCAPVAVLSPRGFLDRLTKQT